MPDQARHDELLNDIKRSKEQAGKKVFAGTDNNKGRFSIQAALCKMNIFSSK